jgi:hypothetical protein
MYQIYPKTLAGVSRDEQQVLVVVSSVVEQEVAGEREKRQRGRGGADRVGGVDEREQGEESECSEEAKDASGENTPEMEGTGGGAVVLGVWFSSAGVRDRL